MFFLFITGVLLFDRYFTHLNIKISWLNIYITEIFIIFSLVISFIVLLLKKNTDIFKQFPQKAEFIIFTVIFLISFFSGLFKYEAGNVFRHAAILYYAIFYILMVLIFNEKQNIVFYFQIYFIFISLIICIVKILNINIANFAEFEYFYISISLIFSLFFFSYFKKAFCKIAALIVSIIFLYFIFNSSVKATWAGLLFAFIFVIFGFIRYKFLRKYLKTIIIVLIILILVGGALFALAMIKYPEIIVSAKEEISGLISFKNLNTISANNIKWRLIAWKDIFNDSLKKPFFGYGFGKLFNSETLKNMPGWYENGNEVGFIDPHNSYLSILYRCGFLGIMAYLWLIIRFFVISLRSIKETNSEKENIIIFCLLTSVVFILFISFFMVILEGPYMGIFLWINMGLIVSLIYSMKNREKLESKLL